MSDLGLAEWVEDAELYRDVPWDKLANRCEYFRMQWLNSLRRLAELGDTESLDRLNRFAANGNKNAQWQLEELRRNND